MSTGVLSKIRGGFIALLVAASLLHTMPAFADLTILPTRVIFEGRDRFAEITLINTGKEAKTYNMGWQFYRMVEETGNYEQIAASVTPFDLTQHLVFSPRRVTLQPGEKQKIRLALRPAADTPAGEYRAHLQFMGERDTTNNAADSLGDGKMRAAVLMNVGYSIPVFYAVGTPDTDAEIESLTLKNDDAGRIVAVIPIKRLGGPYSAHGYLSVYHRGVNSEEKLVGEISNAHIFPEVPRRVFNVVLTDKNIIGGTLRVVYKHYDDKKALVYDEKTFPLTR
jgi:P pilus assembly chaperone PapD